MRTGTSGLPCPELRSLGWAWPKRRGRGAVLSIGVGFALAVAWTIAERPAAGTDAAPRQLLVLCPDGTPAVNATATTLFPLPYSYVWQGDLHPPVGKGLVQVQADGDGRLNLPDVPAATGMLILHERGYAELVAVPASGTTVQLVPWARATGQLVLSGGRAANQAIQAKLYQRAPSWNVFFILRSRTDGQGRFAFDRLPAGAALTPPTATAPVLTIGRVIDGYGTAQDTVVPVLPGQTTTATVGGTGRAVIGRAVPPAAFAGRHDWTYFGDAYSATETPDPPMPDAIQSGPTDQREQWMRDFRSTPAGKAWSAAIVAPQKRFREYAVEFGPDGSFRIEDVAAGTYDLKLKLFPSPRGPHSDVGADELAAAEARFTVPPTPAGPDAPPFELPPVQVGAGGVAAVGGPAPPFTVPSRTGRPVSLSHYRGRYVLLDFWSTWCGPCVAEMPNVRVVYDAARPAGRLAVVGLTLDTRPEQALAYVQKHDLSWDQLWVGGDAGKPVLEAYPSPRGIPQFWLIGPDGRVVAEGQRIEQLRPALAAALGKPLPPTPAAP